MWSILAMVASVGLAGVCAAAWVRAPGVRLHRIAVTGRWLHRLSATAMLWARPDAIGLRIRVVTGLLAGPGMVSLFWWVFVPSRPAVGWIAGPLVAASVTCLLGRVESPSARRRRERMVIDLPHALELLAAAMEAGLPLRNATRQVASITDGPLADDLTALMNSIDLGRSDADGWRSLRTHPVLDRVALDLARSCESGTMVVASLRHHAARARRTRRGALEARAKTVGVKSVPPLVACFVPAFLMLGIVPTGTALFHSFLS